MFFSKALISALSMALVATAAPTASEAQSVNVEARGELVARTTGTFTWYNTGLGACGKTSNDGQLVVALNHALFDPKTPGGNPNKNTLCGKKIRVHYQDKAVEVTVVDRCPGCSGSGDLDLSPAAFEKLAPLSRGVIHGGWDWL
ncbi:RlpA-like double-psi beta-barrel-protein domain-containing protein-containing protein [Cladorrhinum samala]|uniref:RlpA-like double-psi beta-barrel-protein domain-containing protein-containing protein n=1 Tax=Cladorrhinum samala TaxID=585594 RepID=A0AAV9HD48_9PEZI|nr:RlpA-like double-psi beta-barrel-protein domain-containing protein-containing protein [Cladorrhinum samala]